jgi:hypothetical protein
MISVNKILTQYNHERALVSPSKFKLDMKALLKITDGIDL